MITAAELEQLAIGLIERENRTDWRYQIGHPERKDDSTWIVMVRWISPDGDPLDGPGIIHIDETKREAWFVETC